MRKAIGKGLQQLYVGIIHDFFLLAHNVSCKLTPKSVQGSQHVVWHELTIEDMD